MVHCIVILGNIAPSLPHRNTFLKDIAKEFCRMYLIGNSTFDCTYNRLIVIVLAVQVAALFRINITTTTMITDGADTLVCSTRYGLVTYRKRDLLCSTSYDCRIHREKEAERKHACKLNEREKLKEYHSSEFLFRGLFWLSKFYFEAQLCLCCCIYIYADDLRGDRK